MASNNTLIIFYDSLNGKDSLYQAIEEYEATILYDYRMINAIAIKIPTGTFIGDAIEFFKNVDGVIQVNRDYISHIDKD